MNNKLTPDINNPATINRLLIFGSGFIARHIVDYVKNSDGLDIRIIYNRHKVPQVNSDKQIGINSQSLIKFLLDYKPEFLLLLQGQSFVPNNIDVKNSVDLNLMRNMLLLELLNSCAEVKKKIKKILVVGSAAEYGKFYQDPISENFPMHPTSIYGLTKIFLYNSAIYYHERGLPIVYVRQFNIIGPYQRPCFVLPSFCRQIALIEKKKIDPIIQVGDLSQERDFIDVRDAAKAYFTLLQKGNPGEIYNVASGKCISIHHLLNLVLQCSNLKKKNLTVHSDRKLFSKESSLCNRLWADISRLKKLGFRSHYSLKKSVEDTLNYWRNNV